MTVIVVAFDFRIQNPSVESLRYRERSAKRMMLRTVEGIVLSARLHSLSERLRRPDLVLGTSQVRQRTRLRRLPLPSLIIHRRLLSVMGDVSDPVVERLRSFRPTEDETPVVG